MQSKWLYLLNKFTYLVILHLNAQKEHQMARMQLMLKCSAHKRTLGVPFNKSSSRNFFEELERTMEHDQNERLENKHKVDDLSYYKIDIIEH